MQKHTWIIPLTLFFFGIFCSRTVQGADAVKAQPAKKPAVKTEKAVQTELPGVTFKPIFRTNLDPERYADPEYAAKLFADREALVQKILAERQKVLMTDVRAREIHAQILELNKQLAVILENKRAVREAAMELFLVDARIQAMKPAPKEKPVPPAEKNQPAATSAEEKPGTPAPAVEKAKAAPAGVK